MHCCNYRILSVCVYSSAKSCNLWPSVYPLVFFFYLPHLLLYIVCYSFTRSPWRTSWKLPEKRPEHVAVKYFSCLLRENNASSDCDDDIVRTWHLLFLVEKWVLVWPRIKNATWLVVLLSGLWKILWRGLWTVSKNTLDSNKMESEVHIADHYFQKPFFSLEDRQ